MVQYGYVCFYRLGAAGQAGGGRSSRRRKSHSYLLYSLEKEEADLLTAPVTAIQDFIVYGKSKQKLKEEKNTETNYISLKYFHFNDFN